MPSANDVRGRKAETPDPVRALQRKLYVAAKQNQRRRFHALYDKVHRKDVLRRAWEEVARNGGAPGSDGVTIEAIKEAGSDGLLDELQLELVEGRYRPRPARRVTIPKRSGGERHLGVPCVRDRIVQAAAKVVIEPIFEADFASCSFGFRPRLSAQHACERVRRGLWGGSWWVVDADIKGFFDNLDHGLLLALVRARISDRRVMGLIAGWLRSGVLVGTSVLNPKTGTPQGGVVSPLLANIYLHYLDAQWQAFHQREGQLTRYCDDLVIVCRTEDGAKSAKASLQGLLQTLKLEMAEAKTRIVDLHHLEEGFVFLGFHFGKRTSRRNPSLSYPARWPSKAAVGVARDRIRELTRTERVSEPLAFVVKDLNAFLRGWGAYFRHGNSGVQFAHLDRFVFERLSRLAARKRNARSMRRGMAEVIDLTRSLGLYRLSGTVRHMDAHAST